MLAVRHNRPSHTKSQGLVAKFTAHFGATRTGIVHSEFYIEFVHERRENEEDKTDIRKR